MNPDSLFPIPTPDAVRELVLAMFAGGIQLGRVIAEAVFIFIESVGVGVA